MLISGIKWNTILALAKIRVFAHAVRNWIVCQKVKKPARSVYPAADGV
jgi:hypothetical protein